MLDDKITIYIEEKSNLALTPLYYDPQTCRGVVGQKKNYGPTTVEMKKQFNEDLEKNPQIYKPIKVKKSDFEELYKAASKRDGKLVEKIISEKFTLNSSS